MEEMQKKKEQMKQMSEAALAYYENLPENQKKVVRKYFNDMDEDGDGKISYHEYAEFIVKEFPGKYINTWTDRFEALDMDEDGSLNFNEIITMYYMSRADVAFANCAECGVLMTGVYFSCFQCFSRSNCWFYDICCACYRGKKFKHHEDAIFYDMNTLLFKSKKMLQNVSGECSSMERELVEWRKHELHQIADIYYGTVSAGIRSEAYEFFNNMNLDGGGQVSLPEYMAYMTRKGYLQMANPQFFQYLNRSGSGRLNFKEVMTLYYIIQSGRPFCNGCGEFIRGIFFTCVNCFDEHAVTFDVCPTCFQRGNYVHNNRHSFCDNHVLLETKRLMTLNERRRAKLQAHAFAPWPSPMSTEIVVYNNSNSQSGSDRWLEAAVKLSTIASSAVSIISSCSIM